MNDVLEVMRVFLRERGAVVMDGAFYGVKTFVPEVGKAFLINVMLFESSFKFNDADNFRYGFDYANPSGLDVLDRVLAKGRS